MHQPLAGELDPQVVAFQLFQHRADGRLLARFPVVDCAVQQALDAGFPVVELLGALQRGGALDDLAEALLVVDRQADRRELLRPDQQLGGGQQRAVGVDRAAVEAGQVQRLAPVGQDPRLQLDPAVHQLAQDHAAPFGLDHRLLLHAAVPVEAGQVEDRHAALVLRLQRRGVDGGEQEAVARLERRALVVGAAAVQPGAGCCEPRQMDYRHGLAVVGTGLQLVDHDRQRILLDALVDAGGGGVCRVVHGAAVERLQDALDGGLADALAAGGKHGRPPVERAAEKAVAEPAEQQHRVEERPFPVPRAEIVEQLLGGAVGGRHGLLPGDHDVGRAGVEHAVQRLRLGGGELRAAGLVLDAPQPFAAVPQEAPVGELPAAAAAHPVGRVEQAHARAFRNQAGAGLVALQALDAAHLLFLAVLDMLFVAPAGPGPVGVVELRREQPVQHGGVPAADLVQLAGGGDAIGDVAVMAEHLHRAAGRQAVPGRAVPFAGLDAVARQVGVRVGRKGPLGLQLARRVGEGRADARNAALVDPAGHGCPC